MSAGSFTVDADHLGVSERAWATSPAAHLPALVLPPHRRVLVVAPHPDDEVLGAGGLVTRIAAGGAPVHVLGVTDGEGCFGPLATAERDALRRQRRGEVVLALTRLGVDPRRRDRLGLPDGAVERAPVERALRPLLDADTLCIAPWSGDGHPDHDAVGAAARAACAATGASLLHYLVWAWHWADPAGDDLPWAACRRVNLGRRELAAKRWASAAFTSQTRSPDESGLPVLPPAVLARFRRPWEVYVTA